VFMPFHFCTEELTAFIAALPVLGVLGVYARKIKPLFNKAWWFIRGVGAAAYRQLCCRCGYTGQFHFGWRSVKRCLRFKGTP
jgi:hypothetical protein